LAKSLERLSSGQRINSASDDAAGMAIASRMTAQIKGMDAAKRNTQDGISLTQTAEGAMGVQVEQLQRTRELAVQASNGMLSQSDRDKLNTEAVALMAELNEVATNTNFNGNKLLDGSISSVELQVGANTGETRTINLIDTDADTLNVTGETFTITGTTGAEVWASDVSGVAATTAGTDGATAAKHINLQTQDNAQAALTTLDSALDTVQGGRSNMGAYQNRLEQTTANLDVSINNTTASRGRIQDADFAKETADMTKNQILSQAGVAMLSQANQLPQNVLSLLR
jgi:flagellin